MSKNKVIICQVRDSNIFLPCNEIIRGYRCERLEPHSDNHWVGEHTVSHAIMGDAVSCAEVEAAAEEREPLVSTDSLNSGAQPKNNDTGRAVRVSLPSKRLTRLVLYGFAIILVPILAAVAVHFYVDPKVANSGAQDKLAQATGQQGNITLYNSKVKSFASAGTPSADPNQKALATSAGITSPAAFLFTNGKTTPKRVLSVYVDFNGQTSRDSIYLNQSALISAVQAGRIELRLVIAPNRTSEGLYLGEALAEVAQKAPSKVWTAFVGLNTLAAGSSDGKTTYGQLLKKIQALMKTMQLPSITAASISKGTFSGWLLTAKNDPVLTSTAALPVYVYNKETLSYATVFQGGLTTALSK